MNDLTLVERCTFTKSKMNSLQTTISQITEKIHQRKTAIFFGAGLSLNSGIPIVSKILGHLFVKMGLTNDQAKLISNSNLPFEAIMETILEESSLDNILDIFNEGRPNSNHIFLAKLIKKNYVNVVCTTNFDTLLEEALINENLMNGKDFFVYSTQNEINGINWASYQTKIIKIHGCISQKEEMAITMKQVAGRELSSFKRKVIREIFSGKHFNSVLMLGYSCSDLFDISPQLETLTSNLNEVIFVEHSGIGTFRQESITIKEEKNPFKKYIHSSRILIDTDKFIKDIWLNMDIGSYNFLIFPESNWRKKIDSWISQAELESGLSIKYHIGARLLYDIGEFRESIIQNKKAATSAQETNNLLGFSSAMANLAKGYTRLGKYNTAQLLFNKSIFISRVIGYKKGEASQLESLGILLHSIGRNKEALIRHKEALKLNEEMKDEKSISTTLGNMGNVYGRLGLFDKAIEVTSRGLSISQRLGMKQSEGSQLCIIGMAYYNTGEIFKAKDYIVKGINMTKIIGDKDGECMMTKIYAMIIASDPDH